MKISLIALGLFLFGCVYSAPTLDSLLDTPWMLFKRSHEKQYASNDEELLR